MSAEFNKWLQSRLTSHGFATGGIDGIVGPNTEAALKAFQRAKGIQVSGVADQATVAALRSTSIGAKFDREAQPPKKKSSAGPWPHQSQAGAFYGEVGKYQTRIEVPWTMRLAWDKQRTVSRITLHERVAPSASRALQRIYAHYGDDGVKHLGLDLFGGSLNVRRMRGGSRWSMHSWGIAIDFDPERNALRTKRPQARLSHDDCVPFWEAWEDEGWTSLGRTRDFDWMHVQAARV